MESLVITMNGQGDNSSKVVGNDGAKEVDSILQDIDTICNGETPSEPTVMKSTANHNLGDQLAKTEASDQAAKARAVSPPKIALSEISPPQNKKEQSLTEDADNFESAECTKESMGDQQTLSCPTDLAASPDIEQEENLSIGLLKTECQNSTVITSSLSSSSTSSSASAANKDSAQTALIRPPSDSSHLHVFAESAQPSKTQASLTEAVDAVVLDTSLSSSHTTQIADHSSVQPSDIPSIQKPTSEVTLNVSTNSVLKATDAATFSEALVKDQHSPQHVTIKTAESCTETSSSHVEKIITHSIIKDLCNPSTQYSHDPSSVSEAVLQTSELVVSVSHDSTSDTSVNSLSLTAPNSNQPDAIKEITSLHKADFEDSKHETVEFDIKSKELVDALDCEKKQQSEIELNNDEVSVSNMEGAENSPTVIMAGAVSKHEATKLKAAALDCEIKQNEIELNSGEECVSNMEVAANTPTSHMEGDLLEPPSEKAETDLNVRTNKSENDAVQCEIDRVSESNNIPSIQILESSSIASSNLCTEKENNSHEVVKNEEGKTDCSYEKKPSCVQYEPETNVSDIRTDGTNKDGLHETLILETKNRQDESSAQENDLVNDVLDNKLGVKDDKAECIILDKDKVSPPLIDELRESDPNVSINSNYNDTVILIEEDSENSKVEVPCKTNKAADSENIPKKNVPNIDKNEPQSESLGQRNLDQGKTDAEKTEILSDKAYLEKDRKRSVSGGDESPKRKRTKLEEIIKTDVSDCTAMEVIDSDDDVILAEESDANFKTFKPKKVSNCLEKKSVDLEDVKRIDSKDEKNTIDVKDQAALPVSLSSQVLQAFISARIKAFIKKQKQQQIDKLNKRITSMQSSTSLWKETAKHLERSVKEVTVINQSVEKRRAHVNACKKMSSRTVGTQVNDDKVKFALTAAQNLASGPETAATISVSSPSVLLSPSTPKQPPQNPQWSFNQVASQPARAQVPQARASAPPAPSHVRTPPQSLVRPPPPPYRPPPPPSDVVNLIDLTDDDDVSKNSSQSQKTVPSNRNRGSTSGSGGKAVGNVNGFIPLVPNRTVVGNTTITPVQHQHAVAGPKAQTLTTSTPLGQSSRRQNSNLVQPNSQASGNPPAGQANNAMPGSRTPLPGSGTGAPPVSGKQMQESHGSKSITMHTLPPSFFIQQQRHPAPLPQATESSQPNVRALKLPPKPTLKISRVSQGIVLSWNMPPLVGVEVIASYQLFAYQETESPPKTSLWKKVGDVRALPLPMACTLTQFQEGNKYHFAVRAVDKYSRTGVFSDPSSIFLGIGSTNTKIALRG